MERRVLLAISLSFLVLFLYQWFLPPPARRKRRPRTRRQGRSTSPASGLRAERDMCRPSRRRAHPAGGYHRRRSAGTRHHHRDRACAAVFTNRGGRLRHWWLKEYRDAQGRCWTSFPRTPPPNRPGRSRCGLTMGTHYATGRGHHHATRTSRIYKVTTVRHRSRSILKPPTGYGSHKAFVLPPDGYDIYFTAHVMQGSEALNPMIEWGPGLGDDIAQSPPGSFISPNYIYPPQAIFHVNGSRNPDRVAETAVGGRMIRDGAFPLGWGRRSLLHQRDHQTSDACSSRYASVAFPSSTQPPVVGRYVAYSVRLPAPPKARVFSSGPKSSMPSAPSTRSSPGRFISGYSRF